MLRFVYLILGMGLTPFAMEWVNTRMASNSSSQFENAIKGWPAYAVNVIVCLVVAVVVCVLPGGWEISFFNVLILLTVIYFGNQFFFNTLVKPLMKHRE